MGFIYKITNKINGKSYIGQTSRTIEERWKEHLYTIQNKEIKHPLYLAMRKYGKENFTIEEIEEISNDLLNEREQYWIQYYDSFKNGYNATLGGSSFQQFDRNDIIELWENGKKISQITVLTGHSLETVSMVLKSEYNVTQEEIYQRAFGDIDASKERGFCKPKQVYQLNKETNQIINKFDTIRDAARIINPNNIHSAEVCISEACRGRKMTAYGYKWQYNTAG